MRRLVVLLVMLALSAGCVSLPVTGDVGTVPGEHPVSDGDGAFEFTPSGPRPGSTPLKIVDDFLLAMQASPQSTAVARKFLTEEGSAGWFPEKATMVYGSRLVSGNASSVDVDLQRTIQIDDRGSWVGPVGGRSGVTYTLDLVREKDEWRITNPPDALIIPRSHFESRFEQFFVYFFDPTGRVLVPEPTYLPRGEQAATLLVRRLLRGPDPRLRGVLRTYIPGGTQYVLSVPVSNDGVAEVPLSEEVLQLSRADLDMALAQLAWTLRQVAGLAAMRVTVDGSPLDIPGAGSPQRVDGWSEFDPSVVGTSQEIFGIREGRVVALSSTDREVSGRFGGDELALRDVAVDLEADTAAVVTEDGTTVALVPRGPVDAPPGPGEGTVVHTRGADLLRPAWDVLGQLWLVDRTPRGAVLSVVRDRDVAEVEAPGLSGEDVTAFVVSRDGSRVVAVVQGRSGDELRMARVLRTEGGRVRGLTRAHPLPLVQVGVDEIRDVAWRTPDSLAVLTGPSPESSQVLLALVDGSTVVGEADAVAEILRQRTIRLVASPSVDTPMYLGDENGNLFELAGDGEWVESDVRGGLHAPGYVG